MVLEIAAELVKRPSKDALRTFGSKISGYAFTAEIFEFQGHVGFDAKGLSAATSSASARLLGLQFANQAGARVLAVRHNGISLSKLQPYSSWEEVREEAASVWQRYCQAYKVRRVVGFALRYINRIDLPLPVHNLGDWLRTGPEISPSISQEIAGFTMELRLPQRDLGKTVATIREAVVAPPRAGVASVALDIDLRCPVDMPPDDQVQLWKSVEQVHERENLIFESSITDRVRQLID